MKKQYEVQKREKKAIRIPFKMILKYVQDAQNKKTYQHIPKVQKCNQERLKRSLYF